jgi:ubiquinone/menaquinone biosynthesis C-methylase UbiE
MALPILNNWKTYFDDYNEGLGSSYERIILNKLLLRLVKEYEVKEVLEAPIFGFTGITGLNSIELKRHGCNVTLLDDNTERINKVKKIHASMNQNLEVLEVESYNKLPFEDNRFDMAWNFSALWFVQDLGVFLSELVRVSQKIVLLCVPNQSGLGYKWQKAHTNLPEGICFNESYIDPPLIKHMMRKMNWRLVSEAYIDCPPWPDIGMSKEKFLGKVTGRKSTQELVKEPADKVSIVDYYKGNDPGFPARMEKYAILEKHAPVAFKKYWSHHKWMLFKAD